jgi:predicted dienelactone hydrolase
VLAADHPGNTILDALNTQRLLDTIPAGYAQRPLDVLRLIDFADELTGSAGALEGLIDTERIALIGHSFGGYTMMAAAGGRLDFDGLQGWCAENAGGTLDPYPEVALYTEEALSFDGAAGTCFLQDDAETVAAEFGYEAVPEGLWPAVTDERIDALVTFAPWNAPVFGEDGLAEVDVPALIVVGSADSVTNPERDAFTYYDRLGSADKTLAVFDNANHFIYLDECSPALLNAGQFFVCSDAVWDMQRTHDIINHLTTAFLLETLYGDEAAGAAFAEAEFPGIAITPSGNQ